MNLTINLKDEHGELRNQAKWNSESWVNVGTSKDINHILSEYLTNYDSKNGKVIDLYNEQEYNTLVIEIVNLINVIQPDTATVSLD